MTNQNKRPCFVIYKSFYEPIKFLKDDQLGLLFRAVFDYQNEIEIKNLSPSIAMAFAFFKNQFKLDDAKYQKVIERNQSNGSKGGRPKNEETHDNPENPVGYLEPKKADKEKEKGIDKEIDKEKDNKYTSLTRGLKFVLEKKLNKEIKTTKWNEEIRKLIEIDLKPRENAFEDVKKTIQAISDNWGKEFFPVIESAVSLRKKFDKIEGYIAKSIKKPSETQNLANHINSKYLNNGN